MSLTLKVPPPADRQLTESKWEAAEEVLREDPERQSADALLTPKHVYSLRRTPDGSLTRTRTKSREEPNVDLDSPPCARCLLPLLVGSAPDPAPSKL